MRLIHTSDWHLGRTFHGVGLLSAQQAYLDHLVGVVRSEGIEAVLVSGDVYDRALPAPETVTLLSETVTRLIEAGAKVVLSSGNHDSAIRLGFAADLLARAGLHIRSSIEGIGHPVVVGGVAIHALPYLEPALAAGPLEAQERTHAGVIRAAMARVHKDIAGRGLPSVVMAHAFVTGAATSESERDISSGGVSAVHPDVFAAADYAALGHIHRPQRVAEQSHYSGSPVAMSFSEAGHRKGSYLVEIDASGLRSVEVVEAPVQRPLAVLRGDLEDLLAGAEHAHAEDAWVQVTLTDPVRPRAAMERVRSRFPHALDLRFDPVGAPVEVRTYAARVGQARSEVDVCCDFLSHVRGGSGAEDAERALLHEAVEQVRLDSAARDDRVPLADRPGSDRGAGAA